ncbi:MAG: hypothetical protein RQ966_18855 [Acetobacteraceae bacterium]|nr:hypothetical protein [Acetobacteraceae bacterium]
MATNDHWMYQGRQYHQWFGHGTAPKEARDTRPASAGLFNPESAGQRIDYAATKVIGEAPKNERARWERRMAGPGRGSLKTAVAAWYGASGLRTSAFRDRLLDPYTSEELADHLKAAAKGIVTARTYDQLDAASGKLATAAQKVGVDRWPRFLGDAEQRALAAVSENAIPGVIKAGTADSGAVLTILGGLIIGSAIYGALRPKASPPTVARPDLSMIVEAVPLPPRKEGETPADVLKPGGQNVGEPGNSSGVRVLPGGQEGAQGLFDRLTKGKGGENITPPDHAGQVVRLPDGSIIGIRPRSRSGPPTIDIKIPGLGVRELKFPEGKAQ